MSERIQTRNGINIYWPAAAWSLSEGKESHFLVPKWRQPTRTREKKMSVYIRGSHGKRKCSRSSKAQNQRLDLRRALPLYSSL